MTSSESKPKRTMPKGGRKGGSVFPRVALGDAVKYAKKLVSKTHTGAQPVGVIHSGVVGAKGGKGDVRISALKQYGFLSGDRKTGFTAAELAKQVASAPPDEISPLYQNAVLRPAVFKAIFETYHGDTVSRAKLKQRAADQKVHPEETETCIDIYVSSLELAELVTVHGDQVQHVTASDTSDKAASELSSEESGEEAGANVVTDKSYRGAMGSDTSVKADQVQESATPRAVFNVNVTLDSSLDIEKLAKQLELLRRFGAI